MTANFRQLMVLIKLRLRKYRRIVDIYARRGKYYTQTMKQLHSFNSTIKYTLTEIQYMIPLLGSIIQIFVIRKTI
jgi:hypothetical protein